VTSINALLLAWLGRICGGLIFCGGPCYLWFPLPLSAARGPGAALLCLMGIVVMTTTEITGYYLALLATTRSPEDAKNIIAALQKAISDAVRIVRSLTGKN